MARRATPSFNRALAYIETLRASGASDGERLPPLAQLARDAGVAIGTMQRAVGVLAAAGQLTVRRRSGIRWASAQMAPPLPTSHQAASIHHSRGEYLADEIEDALLRGEIADPLPPMKVLRDRYRAGYQAIDTAVHLLAERGIIARRGREWFLLRFEPRHGQSTIGLVGPTEDLPSLAHFGPKATRFCTALERECSTRGTSLRYHSSQHRGAFAKQALGYILIATHETQQIADTVAYLRASNRPVVIVDYLGDTPFPSFGLSGSVVGVRAQGATASARQVALLLRRFGHRRVAFISPYRPGGTGWVGDRLEGVRDIFGKEVTSLWGDSLGPAHTQHWASDTILAQLTEAIEHLDHALRKSIPLSESSRPRHSLSTLIATRATEESLEPLLERAAADPTITAWVAANDETAVMALGYLARRRIAVPDSVSVVGFDGTREGLLQRLTSFDYNLTGVAKTAVNLVLSPPPLVRRMPRRIHDIPGTIIMRDTVAGRPAECCI